MNKVKFVFLMILSISISLILVILHNTSNVYYGAHQAYRVYLSGMSMGLIESKEKLEDYINKEQLEIKNKYDVDKVYAPEGLEIVEETTYNEKIKTVDEIYEEIKSKENFTINGYVVSIYQETYNEETGETKSDVEKIYLLDKNIFSTAVDNTVKSFIDEENYKKYLEENQEEITGEGTLIESVYVKEKITIKKGLIPTNEKIFESEKELSKYMLFGTVKDQKRYIVKSGDILEEIADNNKMRVRDFLIANPNITSEDALLYPGQEVIVDPVDPVITIVEETHEVQQEKVKYTTEIQEDSNFYVGYTQVTREGSDGKNLVTKKIKRENGNIAKVINVSTEVLEPMVPRLVKTGNRAQFVVANTDIWAWPTVAGYTITTYYGHDYALGYYRYHPAIDIAGLGCNSPIYAINDGTVITTSYNSSMGNYIEIDHNNGYVSMYLHLNSIYVKPGQAVTMGKVIAAMGSTGYSTGCHLDLRTKYNGNFFDPLTLYK